MWIKSTLVLCLGQISFLAPPEFVANHVDGPIMLHLLNIINSNKVCCFFTLLNLSVMYGSNLYSKFYKYIIFFFFISFQQSDFVNDVTLQTISKIAKTLLLVQGYTLRQRPLLLTHVVNSIKQENISSTTLTSCLQVMRDLTYPLFFCSFFFT